MNEARKQKIALVAKKSQKSIALVLENITDMHNIGAILRTCDSVGVRKIYVLNTIENMMVEELIIGKRSSMGARKWVDIDYYNNTQACLQAVKKEHQILIGTLLNAKSKSIFQHDLTQNCAIILGNEKSGLSQEAIKYCDLFCYIPMVGMAESLNVSVAAGAILYEAFRQRFQKGFYSHNPDRTIDEIQDLNQNFLDRADSWKKMPSRLKILPK